MEGMKVSVIVPVFNTEKFLINCLNSIINQTYKNLEIIVIDDYSPDESKSILKEYARKDNRIVLIENKKNLGLYTTRLVGIQHATGQYVCFVDSDDVISVDWIRLLLNSALINNADIVVGNTVNIKNNWPFYYNNSIAFTHFHKPLLNENILHSFLDQEGACYNWHTVWNKLYSMNLWKVALPFLIEQKKHLIMTEDMIFSTVLFYFAQKMVFENCDCYFYYKREGASTDSTQGESKILSSLYDIGTVFDFLEKFFKSIVKNDELLNKLLKIKHKYFRIWCHAILTDFPNSLILKKTIKDIFNKNQLEDSSPQDFYFYQVTTEWNSNYENIKKMILNPKQKVISFDIFDTLIVRPFWEPSDLYIVMNKQASNLIGITAPAQFIDMRIYAENQARKKCNDREDITLAFIYDTFASLYNIDKQICDKLCEMEIDLETKFCYRRESGVELLDMAKSIGKRVILTSDMYLDKYTVISILNGLNIKSYDALYLSSDIGLLKSTGNLYRYLYEKEKVEPNQILHIGDNWTVDIDKAKSIGLNAVFFAKTKEICSNKISNIPVGNFLFPYSKNNNTWQKSANAIKDFPIRSLLAIVANKFFDRPNYSFQEISDYNGDMFFIGYFNVGFFLLGLTKWIQKRSLAKGITHINFLSRDGYIPKKAFDKLTASDKRYSHITTNYFYASRKALMPYSMKSPLDFYSISAYINLTEHTPNSILKLLQFIIPKVTDDQIAKYIFNGITMNNKFTDYASFKFFIDNFLNISFDKQYYDSQLNLLKIFFDKNFPDNSAIFDLGYSGKLSHIINILTQKNIDTFFVHDASGAKKIAQDDNFEIENFLDFTPGVSGVILEYFLSSISGSCIGYNINKDSISPIIEEKNLSYESAYPILTIQDGAIEFIDDFVKHFGDFQELFNFNNYEIFAPMLYYLCNAKEFDLYFFNYTHLEDELYGCKSCVSFLQMYDYYINNSNLKKPIKEPILNNNNYTLPASWSKAKKAMFYFVFEKKAFWAKFKKKLKNKFCKGIRKCKKK